MDTERSRERERERERERKEEAPPLQEEAPPSFKKPPPPLLLLLLGGGGLPRTEDFPSKKLSLEEATPPLEEGGDPYPIGAVSGGNWKILKAKIEGRKVVWCSCLVFENMRVNVGKWADRIWNPRNTPVDAVLLTYLMSVNSAFIFCRLKITTSIVNQMSYLEFGLLKANRDQMTFVTMITIGCCYPTWSIGDSAYPVVGGSWERRYGCIHIPQAKWKPEGCTNWLSQLHMIDEVKSMNWASKCLKRAVEIMGWSSKTVTKGNSQENPHVSWWNYVKQIVS